MHFFTLQIKQASTKSECVQMVIEEPRNSINNNKILTTFSTCCEKFWLINVASNAKFLGEFILWPSSCGGSVAVSLTVNKSTIQVYFYEKIKHSTSVNQ